MSHRAATYLSSSGSPHSPDAIPPTRLHPRPPLDPTRLCSPCRPGRRAPPETSRRLATSTFAAPQPSYLAAAVPRPCRRFGYCRRATAATRTNLTSLVSPWPSSRARPKAVPDPTRTVVTVGSGSSPNIPKSSSISCLNLLSYLFSTVRF